MHILRDSIPQRESAVVLFREMRESAAWPVASGKSPGPPAWKQRHRLYSRDYKLVHKAIARGELTLPEAWTFGDEVVQAWLRQKRDAIERKRARI